MSKPPSLIKVEHAIWQLVWELSENPTMDLLQGIKNMINIITPITLNAAKEELEWFNNCEFYM